MTTKQLDIKNRSYYFYNDLINILGFGASNLQFDRKPSMDLDIYYIGYVDKKSEWSVNSVKSYEYSEYEKDYMKINFSSDDNVPLTKVLYFPTISEKR